jgi:EpsI family protein
VIRLRSIIVDRAAFVATAVLLLQAVVYYSGSAKEAVPSIAPWAQFPEEMTGWKGSHDLSIDRDVLNALKPDDYLVRTYISSSGKQPAGLFIAYFNSRRNGRAPHSPQWCLPGAGWKSISSRVIAIPLSDGSQTLPANEYLIEKGRESEFVIYWYHQGTRTVANEVMAQLYSLPDLILHGRTDTALVRIIIPVAEGDIAAAKATAIGFAQTVYPLIRQRIS